MTLNSVRFLTQNDVLATGYYGTLLKSTDAGLTWSNPITTTSIRGFESLVFWNTSFINAATGFMTGNNSGSSTKIYKTTNSGQYWSPVSAFIGSGESIQFLNESTGWATSSLFIFRTTNGGSSWDSNFIPMPSMVRSIYFIDAITGYSCLYRRVYKTTDSGANWIMLDSISADLSNLYFVNSNTGFAAGSSSPSGGLIRKTTDGGLTWVTKHSSPQTGTISSMNFINASTGFAVGGGFYGPPGCILRTTDSGDTWIVLSFSSKYHINSVSFSGNNFIAVGYGGKIFRSVDSGNNWMVTQSFNIPGLSFFSCSFIDAYTGWVTTGNSGTGIIYRTVDGGTTWANIYSGAPYQIDKLHFFNANTGYFTLSNIVYKTTNGGFNWLQMPALNISNAKYIFNDPNTGYAYGNYGNTNTYTRILKTSNGAQSWDTVNCVYGYCSIVQALKFINDNTGWISVSYCTYPMGNINKIFKTINSGVSWSELRMDSAIIYNKMDFKNNNTGWVTGSNRILSTYDGGYTWLSLQLPGSVTSFNMVDQSTGWLNAWNYGDKLLKTTNGGVNWNIQVDLGLAGINEINFINQNTGWAVGVEGMILKTTNGGDLVPVIKINNSVPHSYSMMQNFPNPFNPQTKIVFSIPANQNSREIVTIKIYDVLGEEVMTLVNGYFKPGTYEIDFYGTGLSSGVYFYMFNSGIYTETRKMVLIK